MIKTKILNLGADRVGEILTENIPFAPSLIELCRMNSCGNYGKSYTWPPLIGDTDSLIAKAKGYRKAIAFQKVYPLEDSFDFEGMVAGKKAFKQLTKQVYQLCEEQLDRFLLLGAGACDICKTCGAIDSVPCRFPKQAIASLESYGIQVSSLAALCDMNYINGKNTVTYFGAILCD